MSSTKRQRTSRGSSASSRADSERSGSDSPRPHKSARRGSNGDKENRDPDATKELFSAVDLVSVTPHKGCSGGFPVSLPGDTMFPRTAC
jgi:hypothetical protein